MGMRIDILAEASVKEDNPDDDLYATYAMLHTHRTDDDDYRRISEEIQKKKKKPPPPPPQSNPLFVSLPPTEATLSRSPHRPLPPHPSLSIENAQPMMPPLQFNEADGNQLITINQINLPPSLPHYEPTSWTRDHISREESRDLLSGRPDGTFLVRPKPGVADHIPIGEPLHTHTIDIERVLIVRVKLFNLAFDDLQAKLHAHVAIIIKLLKLPFITVHT
ncbi:PREDICTED: uncharacterized protein LOC105315591 [Amphimedon queenslandica]|uniref:SH2 domain-containing protein n=1 Tax=Amphimedon queenslandica TaxID=400682 RepID=A0AAN0JZ39_AMPQE|nr:PREDICTED: uncharacterized protein LOC105315591 [Amphimedon queenslandica]|eukprot:XP_019862265.1 PREDICTED: uncharacterized protein LOC105315591 [Amphimedon queenslandica]